MDFRNWLSSLRTYLELPQRFIVGIFGFLATINTFVMRHSVDILLTKRSLNRIQSKPSVSGKPLALNPKFYGDCNINQRKWKWWNLRRTEKCISQIQTREIWSGQMRTAIMMSFYLGYIITHIPGTLLAERYGGKLILSLSLAMTALLTLITPFIVHHYGAKVLLVIRILMGLSEGPLFPALNCIITQWIPPQERRTLIMMLFSAGHIAILIVNLLSGVLLPYVEWSLVFYIFGACTLLLLLGFTKFCFNTPESNPYIKDSEKLYLQQSISSSINLPAATTSPPWHQVLSSSPMWTLISAIIQHDWSQSLIVLEIRNLISDLRDTNFWNNLWSCLQILLLFCLKWIVLVVARNLNDVLINRDILNTAETRKLMTLIAAFGPKICSDFTSCLLNSETSNMISAFKCGMTVMSTYYDGIKLTTLDVSPNYAGTLMTIANGLGSITNILAPFLEESQQESGPLQNIRTLIWLICTALISGEVQKFDNPVLEMEKVN